MKTWEITDIKNTDVKEFLIIIYIEHFYFYLRSSGIIEEVKMQISTYSKADIMDYLVSRQDTIKIDNKIECLNIIDMFLLEPFNIYYFLFFVDVKWLFKNADQINLLGENTIESLS